MDSTSGAARIIHVQCMYGRAHTARCRVCMKLRKPKGAVLSNQGLGL